jgi:hypothetical protein
MGSQSQHRHVLKKHLSGQVFLTNYQAIQTLTPEVITTR